MKLEDNIELVRTSEAIKSKRGIAHIRKVYSEELEFIENMGL